MESHKKMTNVTASSTQSAEQLPTDADQQNLNWSRTYWGILVNQILVVGIVAFLATGLLRESYRACRAADLLPPAITQWYFSVGPAGLTLAGFVSIAVSLAVVGLRRRIVAVVLATLSFVGCIVILAGGIFASVAPLLVAIRDMLPPEERW